MRTLLLAPTLFAGLFGLLAASPVAAPFPGPFPVPYHAYCRVMWWVTFKWFATHLCFDLNLLWPWFFVVLCKALCNTLCRSLHQVSEPDCSLQSSERLSRLSVYGEKKRGKMRLDVTVDLVFSGMQSCRSSASVCVPAGVSRGPDDQSQPHVTGPSSGWGHHPDCQPHCHDRSLPPLCKCLYFRIWCTLLM